MSKINAIITGIGGYVPDYVLNNEELSRMVDTNDEWIMTRVGIKERRILAEEGLGTSYMARKAAKQLMQKTGVDPDTIDAVIVATSTADYKFPSTASIVLGKLGLKNAFAFDFWGACCGFLYALDVAGTMVQSGRYKKIIVIGADKMSSVTDYKDRATCPLFGDGAAAVLVEATEEENIGVMDSYLRADGKGLPFLHMKAGGSVCPPSHFTVDHRLHYLYQEGRTVFRYAVTNMSDDCALIAERNGLNKDNITWVVPHQANMRIIEAVAKRLELPMEQVMVNIEHFGNTSAATIPLALWEYEPKLKKGDNIIMTAFGAGFVHGASYLKWAYDGEPNVGKSTLMNQLVGERISIATFKAQTTRHRIMGIVNTDDMQIVFSDTPGVLKPNYKLQESMLAFSESALQDADVLLYVTDVVETPEKNMDFLEKVQKMTIPVLLLINKIDSLTPAPSPKGEGSSQAKLAGIVEKWHTLLPNAEILPISAKNKFGVDMLLKRIKELLPDSPPFFDKDQLTDKPARFFVSEIIREKILLYYDKEIPYSVEVRVERFKETEKNIHINAIIYVERDSQKGIIIGHQGMALKKVSTEARKSLEKFFGKPIFLETFVKVDKDWRSNTRELDAFGYNLD